MSVLPMQINRTTVYCNYLNFIIFNIKCTTGIPIGGVLNSHNSGTTKLGI